MFQEQLIQFRLLLKNNSPYQCRVYYEHTDTTPDLAYSTLNSGSTSGTLTISGLTSGDTYTIYAMAYSTVSGLYSSYNSITATTLRVPSVPTVTFVSSTFYTTTFTIKNNSAFSCLMSYKLNSGTLVSYGSLGAGATSSNITISSLSSGTTYTAYASAYYDFTTSAYGSADVSTMVAPIKPTLTLVSANIYNIQFTVKNNNAYTLVIHYGMTPSTTSGSISVAAGQTSAVQSITGLSANTTYNIYARSYYSPVYSLNDSFSTRTALLPAAPTISTVSASVAGVTFKVKNNNAYASTVYYGTTALTTSGNVSLAGGATSDTLTISSLTPATAYYVYSRTNAEGSYSSNAFSYFTTLAAPAAPTLTLLSKTLTSFTIRIKNNSSYTNDVRVDGTYSTLGTYSLASGATTDKTYSGYSANSRETFTAYAKIEGVTSSVSNVLDQYTYANPVAPTITQVSKTNTTVVFKVKNNNAYTSTVYYGTTSSTTSGSVSLASGATSSNITISSLSANTPYTIYARSYAYGLYSSNDTEAVTTYPNPVAPVITVQSKTATSITYKFTNNNPYTVQMYADENSTPTTFFKSCIFRKLRLIWIYRFGS